ncbi:hypothetical protein [Anaerotignum propionicum]|uniref:Uncharacterized protein n=1 Tax=Anaerotignum propionicum DSM 1682 TaxID=991789 RepID=A0ABM5Y9L7_ANAPI|nr:hypothetical protein [Anaerotignum propionicum]AMJ40704.1 hypothetical protein CPRO_11090 [Anaerotignum propionicum DSM 1682]AMJ41685.1 hypothetical protein CPRO_21050 [Anaerotignum propionicum DSM 1682]AMJ42322.1 hypothetical protein CPRO_27760 [Anaerotignum propionicum DSM 1682]
MYYKKQGNVLPEIKAGCVYEESYSYEGYIFLKYEVNNIPSEEIVEITKEEYKANKPIIPELEPDPMELIEDEVLQAEMLLNQQLILSKQTEIDITLAELLLNQQGVVR